MNLTLNEKYSTGPTANTDLHAGGVFFAIIYKKVLVFSADGVVVLSQELIDPFRPMDDQDVKRIDDYRFKGRYFLNDRQYLECHFEEIDLVLIGLPLEKHPGMLAFHACNKRMSSQWGEVFVTNGTKLSSPENQEKDQN